MATTDFTIFDIPEVLDGNGRHLDQQSLSVCPRVNRTWYHDFLPQLWREVKVYDFDYNHVEACLFEAMSDDEQDEEEDENGDNHIIQAWRTRTASFGNMIRLASGPMPKGGAFRTRLRTVMAITMPQSSAT